MISVIVPFWSYGPEADECLRDCVSRLDYDELILVVNEPNARGEPLVGARMNQGLRIARGDYLVVVTSSAKLISGSVAELCQPDAITSPNVDGEGAPFHGCFFCIPRAIYERHGGLDESFTAYYVDMDFACRMWASGVPLRLVPNVKVDHRGAGGRAHARLNVEALMRDNSERFRARWGNVGTVTELEFGGNGKRV